MYEWYVVIACIVYLVLYLLIAILHTRHNRMHQPDESYYVIHDENGEMHLIWIKDLKDEGSKAQRQDRTHSKRD